MLQTRPRMQPRRLRQDMETFVADTALVVSLLSGAGGCLAERDPDEEEDFTEEEDWNGETRVGGAPDDDPLPPPGPVPATGSGDCCSEHWGGGCKVASVESCVCGLDPKCCTESWDATCVMQARGLCNSCEPLDPS